MGTVRAADVPPRARRSEGGSAAADADERSLNTVVYEAIRNEITAHVLRPGVKLTHQELADRLKVSRTPVREALERLYQEGFVTRRPRRGFYVAEIDEDEARQLYELREALETFALRRSVAKGIPDRALDRLEAYRGRYVALLSGEFMRERMMLDRDFHLELASHAGNDALSRALAAVFERLILKIRTDGYPSSGGAQALAEHDEFLAALRAGRHRAAETALAKHIQGARLRLSNRA